MSKYDASLSARNIVALAPARDRTWAALLAYAAIIAILAVYHQTAWSIISIWERSETFAHGFLIFPISAYLIWLQRKSLSAIPLHASPWALLALGLLGFGWLLASLANVQVLQQYCLIAMIPVTVWAILGRRLAWAIAFPLAYLLLAVPFGEIFIAPMIDLTADFTVHALQMTGIPVFREGSFFTIPSGSWSVVEACSGLRYLIASFTLGTLYAYISYNSLKHRLAFIAFSIIVPIIANGIRAYMIVMIGHLSEMRLAVGVDHLIYGWLFFGLVMLLLFWGGSFWREPENIATGRPSVQTAKPNAQVSLKGIFLAACSCITIISVWPAYARYLQNTSPASIDSDIAIRGIAGKWEPGMGQHPQWKPRYVGTPERFLQSYQNAGHTVTLYLTHYRNQKRGSELITSGNLLISDDEKQWRNVSDSVLKLPVGSQQLHVTQNQLHDSSTKLLVWRWYRIGNENTVSTYRAKFLLAKNHLLRGRDDATEIIIATPYENKPDEAIPVLQDFLNDMMANITKGLNDAESR